MPQPFQLFQTPVKLAHSLWKQILLPGDTAIDATCGNGYDTLALAKLCLGKADGFCIGFDIQSQALDATEARLIDTLGKDLSSKVKLLHASHVAIDQHAEERSVKLIVYNLGYLPGGDKSVTTVSEETLESIKKACTLIKPGGAISITCYPGHEEGKKERDLLLQYVSSLDPKEWSVLHHTWLNRNKAPSLLFLERSCLL